MSGGVWSYKVDTPATSQVFLPEATITAMGIGALSAGTYTFSLASNSLTDAKIAHCILTLSDGQTVTNGNSFTVSAGTTIKSITSQYIEQYTVGTYTCQIQIETGTSATTWTPYSNICPITGHDSVTALDTGVNQWDEQWKLGYYRNGIFVSGTTVCSNDKIKVPTNSNIYLVKESAGIFYYTFYDVNGDFLPLSGYDNLGRFATYSSGVIAVPSGAYYMTFNMASSYGSTYLNDISINYPSTITSKETYKEPVSKTVTLPHTVYGAGVGVTSGEGKEKYGFKRIEDLTVKLFDSLFYVTIDGYQRNDKIKCSAFATTGKSSSQLQDGELTYNTGGAGTVWFKDSSCATPTDFTTKYAGMEICYELIDFTDLSTTPTDLTLYSGDNVISSDGDMELSYVQDMATVIEKLENLL